MRGVTWNEAFAGNPSPAGTVYGLAFVARSGSTWLGRQLQASGVLGDPREYFNTLAAEFSIRRSLAQDFSQYYRYIKTVRQTDGVFGYRIAFPHLSRLLDEGCDEVVADTSRWLFLRRRDMVAQAVSHFRASDTGVFHAMTDGDAGTPPAPAYDADAIARFLLRTATNEYAFVEFFRQRGVQPVDLWYEDCIERGGDAVVAEVAAAVGIEPPAPVTAAAESGEGGPRKLADDDSRRLAARFREERGEFVEYWAENRGRERPPRP